MSTIFLEDLELQHFSKWRPVMAEEAARNEEKIRFELQIFTRRSEPEVSASTEEAQRQTEGQIYIRQYEEMVAKGWTPTPAAKERYEAEKAASSTAGISL